MRKSNLGLLFFFGKRYIVPAGGENGGVLLRDKEEGSGWLRHL